MHFSMGISLRNLALLFVALLVCSAGLKPVRCADADPLTDVSPAAHDNFVLRDVYKNGVVTNTEGGIRAALNITVFPALEHLGITYVHFKVKPCGENLPHTHPRATEILTMVSGGPIQAGVVDTSGKAHIYILYPGDIIIFPRGLLHYELNVGTEEAFFISGLNSQNPGVLGAGGTLLQLPDRAVATALNQDLRTVRKLKKQIYPYSDELKTNLNSGCIPGKDITPHY